MRGDSFSSQIRRHVDAEIELAERELAESRFDIVFKHLERAHVLGQSITAEHTRVHWLMLKLGVRTRNWREALGQILRIIGASTKTPFGIYPLGNTGGSNVSPFKTMPIPEDLQKILTDAKAK